MIENLFDIDDIQTETTYLISDDLHKYMITRISEFYFVVHSSEHD